MIPRLRPCEGKITRKNAMAVAENQRHSKLASSVFGLSADAKFCDLSSTGS